MPTMRWRMADIAIIIWINYGGADTRIHHQEGFYQAFPCVARSLALSASLGMRCPCSVWSAPRNYTGAVLPQRVPHYVRAVALDCI